MPGVHLATREKQLLLSKIYEKFILSTPITGEPKQKTSFTARPDGNIWVKFSPKSTLQENSSSLNQRIFTLKTTWVNKIKDYLMKILYFLGLAKENSQQ